MQRERKYKDPKLNAALEELDTYRKRQRDIEFLTRKLEEYRECYCELEAMKFDVFRVQGGARRDKLIEIALMWADLEVKISEKKAEAERGLWLIRFKLDKLGVMKSRVLELYYLKGFTIIKIANIMGYSEEWVKTTKYNALKEFSRL